jgi:hypothetical protein
LDTAESVQVHGSCGIAPINVEERIEVLGEESAMDLALARNTEAGEPTDGR